jgi:hypothetical protein
MPTGEALHYATQIGDALRSLHEEGRAHGTLTPAAVMVNGAGLHLLPGDPGDLNNITAYIAPERILGHEPDACADLFSFGAIIYEMLTGRPPFEGDTPDALAESVSRCAPAPIGQPGLDRLVRTCLSKDRDGRCQRIQHALMELRLLAGAERRSDPSVVTRRNQVEASMRAEIRQLESQWASLFDEQRHALREACDVLQILRGHLDEMGGQLTAAQERMARTEQFIEKAHSEMAGQQTLLDDRLQHLEQTVTAQAAAIERACNGISRTDDLVERVVESLESLQGLVLEQSEPCVPVAW